MIVIMMIILMIMIQPWFIHILMMTWAPGTSRTPRLQGVGRDRTSARRAAEDAEDATVEIFVLAFQHGHMGDFWSFPMG